MRKAHQLLPPSGWERVLPYCGGLAIGRGSARVEKGDKLLAESGDRPKQVAMDRIFDEGT